MATIADLLVKLRMDGTGLDSGMSSAKSRLDSLAGSAMRVGTVMTAGVTLPLLAVGGVAIKMASDLDESMNKVNVVFGESASEVVKWSEGSAQSMGMSQRAALEYAGTLGNLLVSTGLTVEESANLSTSLVNLSADLASFNNVPVDEALIALRAALVGEYEPMRRFGVQLSEAEVKAKAMALGIYDGEGALTAAAKAQAVYALIMEQTGTAQGDFMRTSDGLANSQRIARAEFENAAAALGTVLLPYMTSAIQALTGLIQGFNGLSPNMQKAIIVIAGVAAAIGPLLLAFGSLVVAAPIIIGALSAIGTAFTALGVLLLANPIVLIITAIIAIIAALYLAYTTNFMGFAQGVNMAIDGLKITLGELRDTFTNTRDVIGQTLARMIDYVIAAKDDAIAFFGEMKTGIIVAISLLWASVVAQFTAIKDTIGTALSTAKINAVNHVVGMASNIVATLTGLVGSAYSMANMIGTAIGSGIYNGIMAMWDTAVGAATDLASAIFDALKGALDIFSPSRKTAWVGEMIGAGMVAGMDDMKRPLLTAADSLAEWATPQVPTVAGVSSAANTGSNGSGQIIQIITLEPSRWQEFLNDAQAGGNFARSFSSELGLRTGAP